MKVRLATIFLFIFMFSCGDSPKDKLIGKWITIENMTMLLLSEDMSFIMMQNNISDKGVWKLEGDLIILTNDDGDATILQYKFISDKCMETVFNNVGTLTWCK